MKPKNDPLYNKAAEWGWNLFLANCGSKTSVNANCTLRWIHSQLRWFCWAFRGGEWEFLGETVDRFTTTPVAR